MKIRLLCLVFLFLFLQQLHAQVNTPDTCKVPFGLISQSTTTPYEYGLIPANLPKGAYKYLSSTQFGKSQDAYTAYQDWKATFVEECSGGSLRVKFDPETRTVSEGIAYGMLLSAYAADKTVFDGLYKYYKTNSVTGRGIMGWNRTGCNNGNAGSGGDGGATDAELDAAMALIIAECQWPAAVTPYDYSAEATHLINAIKTYEIHPSSHQTLNGDGWGTSNTCRNPSYFSPAYYKQFALQVPADSAFWAVTVVNASYAFLNINANATTGLVSNWASNSGTPNTCSGPLNYGYDACRNPWRMATDVLWHNDPQAKALLAKTAAWLKGYSTSCKAPINQAAAKPTEGTDAHNALFTSTWGAGMMGGNDAKLLNEFYAESVKLTDGSYYGTTIRTIMLFMMSGNFWKPCPLASYVELSNFTVTQKAGQVSVNFASTREIENTQFNLYVSTDQQNYTLVKQIPGSLASNSVLEYSFNEERYVSQNVYYKLTFTDSRGTEKELKVQSVFRDTKIEAMLFPNPYEETQTIYLSAPDDTPLHVRIVDMRGKLVMDKHDFPANEEYTLQTDLPSGTYFLVVVDGKKNYSFKLQKN